MLRKAEGRVEAVVIASHDLQLVAEWADRVIVMNEGNVLAEHAYGAGSSYVGARIDVEGLREFRTSSPLMNWAKDLRTEVCRAIYDRDLYPKNLYLDEEPILKNVPTWRCREEEALEYVLDHLPELVVKEVNGSGGYGMLVGPHATRDQLETFRRKLRHDPSGFIAQPTLALSTCPTFVASGVAPRHVDLRPFVLSGADEIRVVPGGLTRVALKDGSLVVNSSQGGGTKDTWVLDG